MKTILINYADRAFANSQASGARTALEIGGFTDAIKYSPADLDGDFVNKNRHILAQPHGAGYWLWKPYIILRTLQTMGPDDVLMYTDAAVDFVGNLCEYFDQCRREPLGMVLFYNSHHLQYVWTKRDCFILMNADRVSPPWDPTPCAVFSRQLNGAMQICRKTDFSIHFYREYLRYCEDARVLTDIPNVCGLPNYDGFKAHRHDQSVASILRFQYNVAAREDISQWGRAFRPAGEKELVNQHRLRR